ncbi:MAG TPA: helix-turn-helix domain-containing protein, partial [Thiotrichales bacterium]|nr:helix-turn-helix domain-containing protein [Thiotrichales bacterium]
MSSSDSNDATVHNIEFGQPLRKAREAQKYSVDEIADVLKVPVQVIESIEVSAFEQLPPATFTRGYLRAYARYVEIADTEVLAAYERAMPQKEHLKPRSSLPGEPSSQSPMIKTVTIVLVVFGVLALIYGGYQYYNEKASSMKADMQTR